MKEVLRGISYRIHLLMVKLAHEKLLYWWVWLGSIQKHCKEFPRNTTWWHCIKTSNISTATSLFKQLHHYCMEGTTGFHKVWWSQVRNNFTVHCSNCCNIHDHHYCGIMRATHHYCGIIHASGIQSNRNTIKMHFHLACLLLFVIRWRRKLGSYRKRRTSSIPSEPPSHPQYVSQIPPSPPSCPPEMHRVAIKDPNEERACSQWKL